MQTRTASWLAVAAGVALEVCISALSSAPEAWDSAAYWSVGLPAAVVACGVLGYAAPANSNRYGFLLMGAHVTTMALRNGGKRPTPG